MSLHLLLPVQREDTPSNSSTSTHFQIHPILPLLAWWCYVGPQLASCPPAVGIFPASPHWLCVHTLLAGSRLCVRLYHILMLSSLPQLCNIAIQLHNQRNMAAQPYNLLGGSKYRGHGVRQTGFKYQLGSLFVEYDLSGIICFLCLYSVPYKKKNRRVEVDNDTAFMGVF